MLIKVRNFAELFSCSESMAITYCNPDYRNGAVRRPSKFFGVVNDKSVSLSEISKIFRVKPHVGVFLRLMVTKSE